MTRGNFFVYISSPPPLPTPIQWYCGPVADPARAEGGGQEICYGNWRRRVAPESERSEQILAGVQGPP